MSLLIRADAAVTGSGARTRQRAILLAVVSMYVRHIVEQSGILNAAWRIQDATVSDISALSRPDVLTERMRLWREPSGYSHGYDQHDGRHDCQFSRFDGCQR